MPFRWIGEQITILAEAFGESLTAARLKIYVEHLADIPVEQLKNAFQRAADECTFFPKIAELRQFAGQSRKELNEAGAVAAWHEVQNFLSKWGVRRWTHSVYGAAPELGERTEYAIRCVGGLERINRASDHEFGYLQKQFIDSWQAFDVTKGMTLSDIVGALDGDLLNRVKQLADGKSANA